MYKQVTVGLSGSGESPGSLCQSLQSGTHRVHAVMETEKRNEGVKCPFSIEGFLIRRTWLHRRPSILTLFLIVNLFHIGLNKKENKDKKVPEGTSLQVELDPGAHVTSRANEHGIGRPGGPMHRLGNAWSQPQGERNGQLSWF